jgi:hypothetical protein
MRARGPLQTRKTRRAPGLRFSPKRCSPDAESVHDRAVLSSKLSAVVAVLFGLFTLPVATGCNTAKLSPAPDAGINCSPVPEAPCKAAPTGCGPVTNNSDPVEQYLWIDASYPANCTMIVNDPTPTEDLKCIQAGTCTCTPGDGGALTWVCEQ